MARPDTPIEPSLGAGWFGRVLVLGVLAVLAVLEVPAPRRALPVAVLVLAPLLTSVAAWLEPTVRARAWTPHPQTAADAATLLVIAAWVPELRGVVAIAALSLVMAAMVRARPADRLLAAISVGTTWVLLGLGPPPSTRSLLAGLMVAGLGLAVRARRLMEASVGRDHRIALLSGRSHAMLRGVAEALFVTTPNGVVVDANGAAIETVDAPDVVGRTCSEVFALETDAGALDCRTCPLLSLPGQDVEVWRHEGAERRTLVARAQPIVDRSGQVVEVLHSLRDVTEITRARDAQNVFLATASHELRTPLTVIRGSVDTVLQRPGLTADQQQALLHAALTRATELDSMISRLLDTSRLRDGGVDVHVTDVDVDEVVAPRVQSIDGASPDHDVSWTRPDELPLVAADERALGVVVDHLLENARKYQPDGGRIEVVVHVDDRRVSLAFRDHGIGMTTEQQKRCFDRFWQADVGDRRRFGGSGVGLYLVRSLVQAMGASIEVWSQIGRGSQFTVHLRRADAPVDPSVPQVNARRESMIDEFMAQVGVTATGRRP